MGPDPKMAKALTTRPFPTPWRAEKMPGRLPRQPGAPKARRTRPAVSRRPSLWLRPLARGRRPHDRYDGANLLSRHVAEVRRQLQRLAGGTGLGLSVILVSPFILLTRPRTILDVTGRNQGSAEFVMCMMRSLSSRRSRAGITTLS
jgi:hypothetical protein